MAGSIDSMDIKEWLDRITGGDTRENIADTINVSRRTLQNQIAGTPKMETVVAIAEAYDANPITALVDLGLVDERHLARLVGDIDAALTAASPEALGAEVLRRLKEGRAGILDAPLNDATVHSIDNRRSNTLDGTVREFDYDAESIAADSSPDEDALREEAGEDPVD